MVEHLSPREMFKNSSTTYYNSSLLFPNDIRADVSTLYSYVRRADNFIDDTPQDKDGFEKFTHDFHTALKGKSVDDPYIPPFIELLKRKKIDPEWIEAFHKSMQQDLTTTTYQSVADTEEYVYGSAEVIGLMMAQILTLDKQSHPAARMLGKAMQWINFTRDIDEDNQLGRTYFPQDELRSNGLIDLTKKSADTNPSGFTTFINQQIERYDEWMNEAEKGFAFIPQKRARLAIRTASDLYRWTATEIRNNPMIVYEKKVKPSKSRVLFTAAKNSIL